MKIQIFVLKDGAKINILFKQAKTITKKMTICAIFVLEKGFYSNNSLKFLF